MSRIVLATAPAVRIHSASASQALNSKRPPTP